MLRHLDRENALFDGTVLRGRLNRHRKRVLNRRKPALLKADVNDRTHNLRNDTCLIVHIILLVCSRGEKNFSGKSFSPPAPLFKSFYTLVLRSGFCLCEIA